MEGRVKFFNKIKGFGFIEGEDGRDYFVHISDVEGKTYLNDGDSVSFEDTEDNKGLKATKVHKTGEAPAEEGQAEEAEADYSEESQEESEEDKQD